MKNFAIITLLAWSLAGHAHAGLITFDLLGDSAIYSVLDNQAAGSVVVDGLTATLTASDGVLNRTASGFGVNGTPTTDDTDALNTDQYIDIVFDQTVVFSNLNISSWNSGTDVGEVQLGSSFTTQGGIQGTGDTDYHFQVNHGETIRIFATNTDVGNGFSVDSFTVEAIPEPAVIGFIFLTGIGLLAARRFLG
jgi:hypothetical protein